MLKTTKSAARLDHLLIEPLDLTFEQLIWIRTLIAVHDLSLRVYTLKYVHRRLVLVLNGLSYKLKPFRRTRVCYKFRHINFFRLKVFTANAAKP